MGGNRHRLLPIDPRPSRADPEARRLRKELEKEHGYEWVPPVVLALLGIGLAYDVTKDVAKHEEKHKREEEEAEERQRRRRRGGDRDRDGGGGDGDDWRRGPSRRPSRLRHSDDDLDEERYRQQRRQRRRRRSEVRSGERVERKDVDDHEGLGGTVDPCMEIAERGEAGSSNRRDGGLSRADLLERGEGGWDRRRATGYDSYDDYDDEGQYRRRRYYDEDDDVDEDGGDRAAFDYEYISERRELEDRRRRRPLPRRRSSNW